MTHNRQARRTFAGLAIFLCALVACSQPPDSPPEIPLLRTATPIPAPALEVALTPPPAKTAVIPSLETPTPIPTIPPSASTIILRLAIAPANTQVPYDRDEWRHWIDADKDCQDTRQEALLEESTTPPEFTDDRECRIATGRWTDPFTGGVFTEPGDLDIDHMVPLANAHRSGGHAWDRERKREYANDLAYAGHLIAVSASANRSKGSKGPDEWRPPDTDYWCQYALDWATIKREWNLTATQAEADALSEMLDTCESRVYIQAMRREAVQSEQTHTPTPTSSPRTAPPTQTRVALSLPAPTPPTPTPIQILSPTPAPPTQTPTPPSIPTPTLIPTLTPTPMLVELPKPLPDRNCSDFATWSEAQEFYERQGGPESDPHKLDRDGDGIACQSLPGAPSGFVTPEPDNGETASLSPTCSDFATWSEAQAFFVSHGGPDSDPYELDSDGNGVPCQSIVGAPSISPIEDLDCSDFGSWAEAQAFYEEQGGPYSDPHKLDGDSDGIACQFLRDAVKTPTPLSGKSESRPRDTHNCSDFATWSEAQNFYESEGGPNSDPHRLDKDGDGVACQSLPGAPDNESTSRSSAKPTPTPTTAPTPTPVPTGQGPAATETPTPTVAPEPEDTHNCSDFDTWQQAQSFFESEGGPSSDPHNLDGNDDGVACQSLPGAPGSKSTSKSSSNPTPTPASGPQDTHNCSDFSTWQEAQSFYESEGGPSSDTHNLDGNDDGVACQSLPGAPRAPTPTPASNTTDPTPAPKSEDTHNCSDFDTWQEAQAFFESEGGPDQDPHRLDGNNDGVACQSLPGAP